MSVYLFWGKFGIAEIDRGHHPFITSVTVYKKASAVETDTVVTF
jgi:hypothetical protein